MPRVIALGSTGARLSARPARGHSAASVPSLCRHLRTAAERPLASSCHRRSLIGGVYLLLDHCPACMADGVPVAGISSLADLGLYGCPASPDPDDENGQPEVPVEFFDDPGHVPGDRLAVVQAEPRGFHRAESFTGQMILPGWRALPRITSRKALTGAPRPSTQRFDEAPRGRA
jgi:hypothetical protein